MDRTILKSRVKNLIAIAFVLAMGGALGLQPSSAGALAESAPGAQSNGARFNHTSARHNQIKCDECHIRRADATKPVMPGHRACIACHIKEYTSTQFSICSNCHEGIKAVQPKVVAFPERQTFGTEFSHKTHATYVSGEKRTDCASCHSVAGVRTTFPAHRECYVCHKAPDQVKAGEKVGGASCSECHTLTGNKKPAYARIFHCKWSFFAGLAGVGVSVVERLRRTAS